MNESNGLYKIIIIGLGRNKITLRGPKNKYRHIEMNKHKQHDNPFTCSTSFDLFGNHLSTWILSTQQRTHSSVVFIICLCYLERQYQMLKIMQD